MPEGQKNTYLNPASSPPAWPGGAQVAPGWVAHVGAVYPDYFTAVNLSSTASYSGTRTFDRSNTGFSQIMNICTGSYRYGFNGHEKDNEIKGLGNHLCFGDYGYDPRIGRRMNIEPNIHKYPCYSAYLAYGNNPIINYDPDGEDKVYFNVDGTERYREKSNTEFKTYIMTSKNASDPKINMVGWKEVPMPKIINSRPTIIKGKKRVLSTKGTKYQEHDYVIAARTGYFNQAKNEGTLELFTEGGNAIPKDIVKEIPDLDPTLVKAIAMQESILGTEGATDIMSANNIGDTPDGDKMKPAYGIPQGKNLSVTNSLYYGIRILATKGFRGGVDGKGGFKFQGWKKAVQAYNSTSGTEGYQEHVEKMQNDAVTPECKDYTNDCNE